mmetsp:Transcript_12878/g.33766  ORF Transcript_12878/g.33766 Transcript_12878/m.33766 type:complete len:286 (-) Transcript_12878:2593-3450(-)
MASRWRSSNSSSIFSMCSSLTCTVHEMSCRNCSMSVVMRLSSRPVANALVTASRLASRQPSPSTDSPAPPSQLARRLSPPPPTEPRLPVGSCDPPTAEPHLPSLGPVAVADAAEEAEQEPRRGIRISSALRAAAPRSGQLARRRSPLVEPAAFDAAGPRDDVGSELRRGPRFLLHEEFWSSSAGGGWSSSSSGSSSAAELRHTISDASVQALIMLQHDEGRRSSPRLLSASHGSPTPLECSRFSSASAIMLLGVGPLASPSLPVLRCLRSAVPVDFIADRGNTRG